MSESIIDRLASRHSLGAKFLTSPAPSAADYEQALRLACVAPDHGRLHPARFVLIENREKLADFFESGALNRGDTPEDVKKARSKALKAPAIVAVIVRIEENNPRVPAYEQWMTAGAATANFLSALEQLGFGGKIVSGSSTTYPDCVKALCRTNEHIAGWIMLGTPTCEAPASQAREVPAQMFGVFS